MINLTTITHIMPQTGRRTLVTVLAVRPMTFRLVQTFTSDFPHNAASAAVGADKAALGQDLRLSRPGATADRLETRTWSLSG